MRKRIESDFAVSPFVAVIHFDTTCEFKKFSVFGKNQVVMVGSCPLRTCHSHIFFVYGVLLHIIDGKFTAVTPVSRKVVYGIRIFKDTFYALFQIVKTLFVVFSFDRKKHAFVVLSVGIRTVEFKIVFRLFKKRCPD